MGAGAVARGPGGVAGRRLAAALLAALFVLHQDVWFWRDARVLLGLPVGLAYHLAFCVAVTLVLVLAVRWGWPREVQLEDRGSDGDDRAGERRA